MAPVLQGSRVTRRSARRVSLSRALARSAGARRALISLLWVWLSGHSAFPLTGTWMPMPAPAYPFVGQGWHAGCGCRVERGQGVDAGGGDVVGRAGFDV
jgi:hypothetical protein